MYSLQIPDSLQGFSKVTDSLVINKYLLKNFFFFITPKITYKQTNLLRLKQFLNQNFRTSNRLIVSALSMKFLDEVKIRRKNKAQGIFDEFYSFILP